ncbi:MAG: AmmeMemoRadiSam system protein B [Chloroflexi bacterium]|nr:AmmeMemoRadiSam system protein B [Chloroflexota bacterium]
MTVREPVVAGLFYPADPRSCTREIEAYLGAVELPDEPLDFVAGIAPHAGWTYSAETAAHTLLALAQQEPDTVVLFGAVHMWGVPGASIYAEGAWRTPLGDLPVDAELAQAVGAASALVRAVPSAHAQEHSIEVQLPFVRHLLPRASILPIAVPPIAESSDIGRAVARATQQLGRRAVALGSTDLTHYGPRYSNTPAGVGEEGLRWTHENDRRVLSRIEQLDAPGVLSEVRAHHNACGAGAVAAAIGFAVELGATRGMLLHYTTSYEVMPLDAPSDLVGYGAMALVR